MTTKQWTDESWCTCADVECPMCSQLAAFHIIGCPGAAHGMCLQYLDIHSSARTR